MKLGPSTREFDIGSISNTKIVGFFSKNLEQQQYLQHSNIEVFISKQNEWLLAVEFLFCFILIMFKSHQSRNSPFVQSTVVYSLPKARYKNLIYQQKKVLHLLK